MLRVLRRSRSCVFFSVQPIPLAPNPTTVDSPAPPVAVPTLAVVPPLVQRGSAHSLRTCPPPGAPSQSSSAAISPRQSAAGSGAPPPPPPAQFPPSQPQSAPLPQQPVSLLQPAIQQITFPPLPPPLVAQQPPAGPRPRSDSVVSRHGDLSSQGSQTPFASTRKWQTRRTHAPRSHGGLFPSLCSRTQREYMKNRMQRGHSRTTFTEVWDIRKLKQEGTRSFASTYALRRSSGWLA